MCIRDSCQNEEAVEEDEVDSKFEEFHEELNIFSPDEGSSEDDWDDACVLSWVGVEVELVGGRRLIVWDLFGNSDCYVVKVAAYESEISNACDKYKNYIDYTVEFWPLLT